MLEDFANLSPNDAIVQSGGATSIVGQCIIQLTQICGIHNISIIRDKVGSNEAKEKNKVNKVQFDCTQLIIKYMKPLNIPLAFDGPIFIFIFFKCPHLFLNSQFTFLNTNIQSLGF